MTKEELINSGNLEAYLLGDLTTEESAEVEKMASADEAIKSELTAIEEGLMNLAQSSAVDPPNHLKQSILNQVENDPNIHFIKKTEKSNPDSARFMMAASVAIIGTGLAFYFYMSQQKLDLQLSESQNQTSELLSENTDLKNELNKKNRVASIASEPAYSKIVLASTKEGKTNNGVIYWDNSNGELYFIMNITESIANTEDFQLWAIIDGKPVDAGVLNLNQSAIQEMRSMKGASAFAVTIEPKGGSENPTLENMIMAGAVSI